MLINRSDLRLALVAGLSNGLGAISGIPLGYYAPMAVLAVCSGSYGNARELGRQRLLGSLLGAAMLTLGLQNLQQLPLPVGLAISLGAMRLLGGALGLRVGYKVGGFVVVMGWLVHRQGLEDWLALRLAWTALGIVLATLSLQLLWPARAIVASETAMAALIEWLACSLTAAAASIAPATVGGDGAPPPNSVPSRWPAVTANLHLRQPQDLPDGACHSLHPDTTHGMVRALEMIRHSLPEAQQELGANPQHHPRIRVLNLLVDSCSPLIGLYDELVRQPLPPINPGQLAGLAEEEAELLQDLSQRLQRWAAALRQPRPPIREHPLPAPAPPACAWRRLDNLLQQCDLPLPDLDGLQRHAAFLSLLGLAAQRLHDTEQRWRQLGRAA